MYGSTTYTSPWHDYSSPRYIWYKRYLIGTPFGSSFFLFLVAQPPWLTRVKNKVWPINNTNASRGPSILGAPPSRYTFWCKYFCSWEKFHPIVAAKCYIIEWFELLKLVDPCLLEEKIWINNNFETTPHFYLTAVVKAACVHFFAMSN